MSEAPPTIRILLADDDKDDIMLFEEALEEIPLRTTFSVVHDGEQLMRFLTREAANLPTVIFLDLNMPRKNGMVCLEEIKRSDDLRRIPIIIFSTSYQEIIANLLYKNGAHYYICKPADFSELKKVIAHSLQLISKEKTVQPPKEKFLLSPFKSVLI